MEQFIPPATIIALYSAFSLLKFENHRLERSIYEPSFLAGRRGRSDFVALFVVTTGFLATLLGIGALGLVFWKAGWQIGLGLLVISYAVVIISTIVTTIVQVVMGGELIATLGLWPLGYFLIQEILTSYTV